MSKNQFRRTVIINLIHQAYQSSNIHYSDVAPLPHQLQKYFQRDFFVTVAGVSGGVLASALLPQTVLAGSMLGVATGALLMSAGGVVAGDLANLAFDQNNGTHVSFLGRYHFTPKLIEIYAQQIAMGAIFSLGVGVCGKGLSIWAKQSLASTNLFKQNIAQGVLATARLMGGIESQGHLVGEVSQEVLTDCAGIGAYNFFGYQYGEYASKLLEVVQASHRKGSYNVDSHFDFNLGQSFAVGAGLSVFNHVDFAGFDLNSFVGQPVASFLSLLLFSVGTSVYGSYEANIYRMRQQIISQYPTGRLLTEPGHKTSDILQAIKFLAETPPEEFLLPSQILITGDAAKPVEILPDYYWRRKKRFDDFLPPEVAGYPDLNPKEPELTYNLARNLCAVLTGSKMTAPSKTQRILNGEAWYKNEVIKQNRQLIFDITRALDRDHHPSPSERELPVWLRKFSGDLTRALSFEPIKRISPQALKASIAVCNFEMAAVAASAGIPIDDPGQPSSTFVYKTAIEELEQAEPGQKFTLWVDRQITDKGMSAVHAGSIVAEGEKSTPVIVKEVPTDKGPMDAVLYRELLAKEAVAMNLVNELVSPFLGRCYGKFRMGKDPILILHRIKGFDLQQLMKNAPDGIPAKAVCEIFASAAIGLDDLYNKRGLKGSPALRMVHLDIKRQNIMVDCEGNVRLIDFGIAARPDPFTGKYDNSPEAGTRKFASPEQFYDHENIGPKSDVYAWARTMIATFGVFGNEEMGELPRMEDREKAYQEIAKVNRYLIRTLPERLGLKYAAEEGGYRWEGELANFLLRCLDLEMENRPTARECSKFLSSHIIPNISGMGVRPWAQEFILPSYLAEQERIKSEFNLDAGFTTVIERIG